MARRVHEKISLQVEDVETLAQAAQKCGLDLPHYLSEVAEVKAAELRAAELPPDLAELPKLIDVIYA